MTHVPSLETVEVDVVLGGRSYTLLVDAATPSSEAVNKFVAAELASGNKITLNDRQRMRLLSAVDDARSI